MNNESSALLHFVRFKDLTRWDVKTFAQQIQSSFKVVKLGQCIYEHSERENIFEYPEKDFPILGVTNKGGVYLNGYQKGIDINQPYKKVNRGDITYNPYRVNVGSIGIVPDEYDGQYISPAYVVFGVKKEVLNTYMAMVLKSDYYNVFLRRATSGSVRQNLTYNLLESLPIPLPSLEEQKTLVDAYTEKTTSATTQEKEAQTLEAKIDEYLFETLGIEKAEEVKQEKGKLHFVRSKNLSRWGVEFIKNGYELKKILFSQTYEMYQLGDLVEINPSNDFSNIKNKDISFIPMENVSDIYGEILQLNDGNVSLSKGYTKFKNNDLIWAKITPCMQNGKSAVLTNMKNGYGYGSTEFHVIRNYGKSVNIHYIYNLLRMKYVCEQATYHFTGSAGQQRVPSIFLQQIEIPLPPMEVQNAIVERSSNLKQQIKTLRQNADLLRKQAQKNFEDAVFIKGLI